MTTYVDLSAVIDTEVEICHIWNIIEDEDFFERFNDIINDYSPKWLSTLLSGNVDIENLKILRNILNQIIDGTVSNS